MPLRSALPAALRLLSFSRFLGSFGLVWPNSLLAGDLKIRPVWTHSIFRSLVIVSPGVASFGSIVASSGLVAVIAGTGDGAGDAPLLCNSSGVGRSGNTFIFGCIWLHFVAFPLVYAGDGAGDALGASPSSSPSPLKGEGTCRSRDARFPSARESLMLALRPTPRPATDGGREPWPDLAMFSPVYSYGRGWNEATLALVGFVRSSQERRNF